VDGLPGAFDVSSGCEWPWRGKVFPTTDHVFRNADDVIRASASRHMPDGLGVTRFPYVIGLARLLAEPLRRNAKGY
jgi:hypothetical protein